MLVASRRSLGGVAGGPNTFLTKPTLCCRGHESFWCRGDGVARRRRSQGRSLLADCFSVIAVVVSGVCTLARETTKRVSILAEAARLRSLLSWREDGASPTRSVQLDRGVVRSRPLPVRILIGSTADRIGLRGWARRFGAECFARDKSHTKPKSALAISAKCDYVAPPVSKRAISWKHRAMRRSWSASKSMERELSPSTAPALLRV